MHAIEYNPARDEIVVPQPFAQAILTFPGDARGEQRPVRIIQGPQTQLRRPDRLAIDPAHNEIFVPDGDAILVFPLNGQGDIAPLRILQGPDTQLGASAVAVDTKRDLLVVAGSSRRAGQRRPHLLVFNRTDQGNRKPKAVIAGPKTKLNATNNVRVIPSGGWILVADSGTDRASDESFVGIWSIQDNGDVAPRWTLGGPKGPLLQARGIALDPDHRTVMISDKYLNAVLSYAVPDLF
ncbi:MAG: hypothetical protein HYX74_04235 [Acidobacteria bacterium]|nr:hypothetical protein [Acidobacteriota bacterium]